MERDKQDAAWFVISSIDVTVFSRALSQTNQNPFFVYMGYKRVSAYNVEATGYALMETTNTFANNLNA